MRRKTVTALAALAFLGAGFGLAGAVRADDDCRVPMAEWQPREALKAKLEAEGWQRIDQVKVDDGCYEAEGYDREGFRVEAKYDPKSFELVKLERKRNRQPTPAAAAPGTAPAAPGSTDGSRAN